MSVVEKFVPGEFCWIDLATTDIEAAKKFYGELLGWSFHEMPAGSMPYTMCLIDGKQVAAMAPQMEDQKKMGIPPNWMPYVSVASCDAATAKAVELGGKVLEPPFDVMDVGRMSALQDPSGAVLSLWEPRRHQGAARVNEPGAMCWFELATRDTAAAETFYTQLFGWTAKKGSAGGFDYTEFHLGEKGIGGMMPIAPEWGPHVLPHWTTYFVVTDCDAAVAKAQKMGGGMFMPPVEVPNVGRFSMLSDPQGAMFAVIKMDMRPA